MEGSHEFGYYRSACVNDAGVIYFAVYSGYCLFLAKKAEMVEVAYGLVGDGFRVMDVSGVGGVVVWAGYVFGLGGGVGDDGEGGRREVFPDDSWGGGGGIIGIEYGGKVV